MKRIETLVLTAPEEHAALGCFIEIFRKHHQLTQAKMGERIRLGQGKLSRLEGGHVKLNAERVEEVLHGLGLDADQLGTAIENACTRAQLLNAEHRHVKASDSWYTEGVLSLGPEAMQGLLTFCCWAEFQRLFPGSAP